jgi:uncharacterized protein DUF929
MTVTPDSPATDSTATDDPVPVVGGTVTIDPSGRRAPMALMTGAFVLLVLLIVAVLLVVKVTRGTTTVTPPPVAPAAAAIVRATTSVPALDLNAVGAPATDGPAPVVLAGQSPLVIGGRPGVVYVGSEFCPYCAAARWSLVVALSRFGTLGHLGATSSSDVEAFPGIATFSFDGSTYRSRYLSWSAVEEYGQSLAVRGPAGFSLLHPPTAVSVALMRRYSPVGPTATLPFIDVGNRLLIEGAGIGFSPGVLQGLSMGQIATDLSDPTSAVAQAVLGTANEITAGICTLTKGQPGSVCRSAGVRAGASRLGL